MCKKLCAAVVMLSMLLMQTVQAAAPLVYPGKSTVVFEQQFKGESKADFPEFNLNDSGVAKWTFGPQYVIAPTTTESSRNASIWTKNSYDLSTAAGVEFSFKCIAASNGFTVFMGNYQLRYVQGGYKMYLFGPGQSHNAEDYTTNNLANVALPGKSAYWCATVSYTVTVSDKKITVSTSEDGEIIAYEADSKIDLSGKFGIQSNYTGDFTVFNMALTRTDSDITVNKWRYETNFSTDDSVDKYKAEGLTLPSASKFYAGYVATGSNATYSFAPDGQKLSGDYGVEYTFAPGNQNANMFRFNHIDSKNYYEIYHYRKAIADNPTTYPEKGLVLRKYENGSLTKDLKLVDVAGTYFDDSTVPYKYTVKVKNTADGLSINVGVNRTDTTKDTPIDFTVTDETPFTESGKVYWKQSYTGDKSKMYSLVAYSLVSESEQEEMIKYTEVLTDKEFTSSDSVESLALEGYSFSKTPNGFTDTGVDLSNNGTAMYYTNENLSGNYEFTAQLYRKYNDSAVRFNIQGSNYYEFAVKYKSKTDKYMKLTKYVDGVSAGVMWSKEVNTEISDTYNYGYCNDSTYHISQSVNEAGDLTLNITYTPHSSQATPTVTGEIKDCVTDVEGEAAAGVPFTGGKIALIPKSSGIARSLKIIRYAEEAANEGEIPVFTGRFYCGDDMVKSIVNGTIYFEYPTAMLGSYIVAAAIYENHEMTDMKVLDPIDLYGGKIKLFNVTEAENTSIKIFFFDSSESLNKTAAVYELN